MSAGRLIAVVGPSGVGKDSVIAGIKAAKPAIRRVRRVITRAPDLGDEEYDAVSVSEFTTMAANSDFCIHWGAHGLLYGVPQDVLDAVKSATDCLANFSRSALPDAAQIFPVLKVLHLTATPETLAQRLAGRGRETKGQIANRLTQAKKPLPAGLDVTTITNDGPLSKTVARALAALKQLKPSNN